MADEHQHSWQQHWCHRRGASQQRPHVLTSPPAACLPQALGAGEILLNCIDNDGVGQGFDIELVDSVSKAVTIPVIASSGAGEQQAPCTPRVVRTVPTLAAPPCLYSKHVSSGCTTADYTRHEIIALQLGGECMGWQDLQHERDQQLQRLRLVLR